MVPDELLYAFQLIPSPSHPWALGPALEGLPAAQQLPLVTLLARLLDVPEQKQEQQQAEEVRAGALTSRSLAAQLLAFSCLAKGRAEHRQKSQPGLLHAALRQLEVAHAAAGGQPDVSAATPANLLQLSALNLVPVLLTDEAAALPECSRSGAGSSATQQQEQQQQQSAQMNAVVVEAMETALPHLHSLLAAAAAAFSAGDSMACPEAVGPVNDVVSSWSRFSAMFDKPQAIFLVPTRACQAAAAGAAETLLRLAPLLPRLPVVRSSPGANPDCVAAGSPRGFVAWGQFVEMVASNPPQSLAITSAELATWLLRATALDGAADLDAAAPPVPGSESSREKLAAARSSSGSGSGSREEQAAALCSTAMAAFKFQWALTNQAALPARGDPAPQVFSWHFKSLAAGGSSQSAHLACGAALDALLAVLHAAASPQHRMDVQR